MKHLIMSQEASRYRETYLTSTSPDRNFYKPMGLRKDNFFMNRYVQMAHHTNLDDFSVFCVHQSQRESFMYRYINPL